MKKNIAMRIAAFLFILTMISTCAFATTFAKYTSTGKATDTARVAKWGVEITADTTNGMFSKTEGSEGSLSVSAETKVVAPGTSGELAGFKIKGQPEVAVKVTYAADIELVGWMIGSDIYCPIAITVGQTEYTINENELLDEFELRIEGLIAAAFTAEYAAGEDLSQVAVDPSISWSWAYSTSVENDIKDTALGDLAAENENNAPKISLSVTCTVTQKD